MGNNEDGMYMRPTSRERAMGNNEDGMYTPAGANPWWEWEEYEQHFVKNPTVEGVGEILTKGAIDLNLKVNNFMMSRVITAEGYGEIVRYLESLGARKICSDIVDSEDFWIWNNGACRLRTSEGFESGCAHTSFVIHSLGPEPFRLLEIINLNLSPPPPIPLPEGRAYVLSFDGFNIELLPIGLAGKELVRENYTDEVLKGFDRAAADLKSGNPRGRLTILDGPPGTGKTFMLKAFMNATPKSKFVIVPPHLIKTLAEPRLIETFIRENESNTEPTVLVLEDADQCLSKRKSENMESISSILNLSDGIVGSLLNLRIIATTNTPASEFDAALLRKGRISAHIKMGTLGLEDVCRIWTSLSGRRHLPSGLMSTKPVLADVYAAHNELTEIDKALADLSKEL